jgi:hypothetical protein
MYVSEESVVDVEDFVVVSQTPEVSILTLTLRLK